MAAILTFSLSLRDRLTTGGVHLWEINRRGGFHYGLQLPEAAINPREDAISIDATYAMRATFAGRGFAATLKLFDALASLLTGIEHNH